MALLRPAFNILLSFTFSMPCLYVPLVISFSMLAHIYQFRASVQLVYRFFSPLTTARHLDSFVSSLSRMLTHDEWSKKKKRRAAIGFPIKRFSFAREKRRESQPNAITRIKYECIKWIASTMCNIDDQAVQTPVRGRNYVNSIMLHHVPRRATGVTLFYERRRRSCIM